MKKLFILLLLLPLLAIADIYKWLDSRGEVHFSSTPVENAKKLAIKPGYDFYRVKTVYDGDTVVLENGVKVRLLGINAPEVQHRDKAAEAGGEEAKAWLSNLLKSTRVRLETDVERSDHYGRTLAHLFTESKQHINLQLVETGLAAVSIFPPNLLYADKLQSAQAKAEGLRLGIWQRPEYQPIAVADLDDNGHFGWTRLVGQVTAINATGKYLYLEFSDRFNARIERQWLPLFPDLNSYLGKQLEVRGWLNRDKQHFSMLIRHPSAIKRL